MITKEDFLVRTNEDEVFAMFHSILERIKENRNEQLNKQFPIMITDKQIGTAIKQMLRDYDNQIKED